MKDYSKFKKVIVHILLLVFAIFPAFPIVWMLLCSVRPNVEIFAWPPIWISQNTTFDAYANILTDSVKVRYFLNSYFVASAVVILTIIISILAAYAFSRFKFVGKGVLNGVIISIQALPPITLLIPYLTLVVSLGLYNSYKALIFTYMLFTIPYAILMLTGYMNTLPKDLDEAVMIDGGSRFRALWSILVPTAIPALVSVGMYTFMRSWNEYLFALTLTKTQDMRTVPVGINLLMGQYGYEWSEMMAMSVIGSLPVLLLFLFFQKYFIAGLTSGSVKS